MDVLEQGLPDSLICRPLKHDVAVFDKLIGELRINAETIPQREIYRRLIGKHLFGNEEMFPPGEKFTLGPLLEYGEASLSVAMIEELTSVECHSVKMLLPGHKPEELTSRRQDVLEVLEQRMKWLARQGYEDIRLTEAKFNLLFASSRRSRVVTIKPPNVAIYSRDGDSEIVERFLRDRGFITEQDWQPYAIDGAVLAGSYSLLAKHCFSEPTVAKTSRIGSTSPTTSPRGPTNRHCPSTRSRESASGDPSETGLQWAIVRVGHPTDVAY